MMYKLLAATAIVGALLCASPNSAWAQEDPVDQIFTQLDADGDGKLSPGEFTAHPDLNDEAFTQCDTNGDKSVSKAEFQAKYGKA
jgi:hypothetical protein